MAQSSVGFAGTVNDAEWAVISGFLGSGYSVGSNGHLACTAIGGSRAVSVAAGIAYGDGVQTTLSGSETVALATPTNGQWYLVVLRRIWATNTTSLVAIPHSTTSNTVPIDAPSTYPAAMQVNPGVQSDQPVAWAWCNSANTTVVVSDLRQVKLNTAVIQSTYGTMFKTDPGTVAFTKTGAGTAQIKAGTIVEVNGLPINFASATSIVMPSLTSGTDYFIYAILGGTLRAVEASGTWPTPVSSPPANSRLIGGFHYAPGGNASAVAGGDTTPQINEYSFWDLKFKPTAADPRGMTLVANMFWADIYMLGRNPQVDGTSRNNKLIADGETGGTTTAIVPTAFGGNGSTRYPIQSWFNTSECLMAFGKRLPKFREFATLAYGSTSNISRGNDPVTTGLGTTNSGSSNADQKFTSKWGVIQASGVMWAWGDEFGGGTAASAWADTNGGRGQLYQQENAVILSGNWGEGVNAGSRAAAWDVAPSASVNSFGGRGVCDHLILA